MGSKSKKLAKKISKATKSLLSKQERKKYASLIDKTAKKLGKKIASDRKANKNKDSLNVVNKRPLVWKTEVSDKEKE